MYSLKLRFASLLALVLLTAVAWAQSVPYSVPAASIEDQFSVYHQALNNTADGILDSTQHPSESMSAGPAVNSSRADSDLLRQFAQQYWGGQEQNVRRAVERLAQLRLTLDPILQEEGVPVDLAALVLVESGGRTTALSPKGALGLWQFMPETARRYGLVVGSGRDERLDIAKSTRAAAHYLRDLYSQFSDWSLAFAAYNAGEEAIQREITRSRARDFKALSQDWRLPVETRHYVPAVLDAIHLIGGTLPMATQPAQHSFKKTEIVYANVALSD
jgi:membrane-bound lytic murein transglycosylase D